MAGQAQAANQPAFGPQPPKVTLCDLWRQVRVDIAGKEVQVAETTSHSWLANQLGHITLGILIAAGFSLALRWLGPSLLGTNLSPFWENAAGALTAGVLVVGWEVRAYWIDVRDAMGPFRLDIKLLHKNAVAAALYMVLGVLIAFVYREFALAAADVTWWFGWSKMLWAAIIFGLLTAIGILAAVFWLRQKIIWQKAALPYLFRLSNARARMLGNTPQMLQDLIDDEAPAEDAGIPCQVVVAGPIGSGRTSFAAGIGTEFAFKHATVRYVSAGNLAEFAARQPNPDFADDVGPTNIGYWRWSRVQVLVVDDIGPMLGGDVEHFKGILNDQFGRIREVLVKCHTVWVIGSLRNGLPANASERFAREIRVFCSGQKPVLVVELDRDPNPMPIPDATSIVKATAPRSQARYV